MNVFEDLIVELKEENLLEETILDFEFDSGLSAIEHGDQKNGSFESNAWTGINHSTLASAPKPEVIKKRVSEQIVSLQMVDHVITAVERGFLQVEPEAFDDLSARKALHRFAQASVKPGNDEYFEAESRLLLEMEAWMMALAARDKEIPVAALRRYCETAQPPLSPQAMFSLVRFYRSSAPTEESIGKFDFVLTRLFSKPGEDSRRTPLCARQDAVGHLRKRYAEWGVAPYAGGEGEVRESNSIVREIDEFIAEAEQSESLTALARGDYFERLLELKKGVGELFFSPAVAAAAIDCNLRVSNRLMELLQREKAALGSSEAVLRKHSRLNYLMISDAVGRTIVPDEVLDHVVGTPAFDAAKDVARPVRPRTFKRPPEPRPPQKPITQPKEKNTILGANPVVVVVFVLTVLFGVAYFFLL